MWTFRGNFLETGVTEAREDWFYIQGGERQGPVIFSVLKSRYKSGDLNEKTLVWTASFGFEWK
ncbi:DUF4339 domain-containing protein [Sulfitobacter sp.]|uniref:DUF4339 domain-containing protein n=1 Tax=Sulfitobacter sp. TaxID=1903071 RepID=UPI0040599D62